MKKGIKNNLKSKKTKKAVSEMIAYVLLTVITLSLAAPTYYWIKKQINLDVTSCKEETYLMIESYNCSIKINNMESPIINLTIKNNGNFNVSGFFVKGGSDPKKQPVDDLISVYPEGNKEVGLYLFESPLFPGNETEVTLNKYFPGGEKLRIIEIQPFVLNKKNVRIACSSSFKQEIYGC
ncbi:MAG: hypothetical protein ACP5OG_00325 [Candidatus Nanoarchaeia archaeon]